MNIVADKRKIKSVKERNCHVKVALAWKGGRMKTGLKATLLALVLTLGIYGGTVVRAEDNDDDPKCSMCEALKAEEEAKKMEAAKSQQGVGARAAALPKQNVVKAAPVKDSVPNTAAASTFTATGLAIAFAAGSALIISRKLTEEN